MGVDFQIQRDNPETQRNASRWAREAEGARMPRKKGRKVPAERSNARLTRHERNEIERLLDRGGGCREIARGLDRAPSTVANEVARHRLVTAISNLA